MKRSPLHRKVGLSRSKPPARKPARRKVESGSRMPDDVIAQVVARSFGMCEARTPWCKGRATEFHHRRGKAHNEAEDILHCCAGCHGGNTGYIHSHPAESYEKGWMVKRNSVSENPLTAESGPG